MCFTLNSCSGNGSDEFWYYGFCTIANPSFSKCFTHLNRDKHYGSPSAFASKTMNEAFGGLKMGTWLQRETKYTHKSVRQPAHHSAPLTHTPGTKSCAAFLHFYKVQQTKRKHTPTLSPNTRLRRDETIQSVKVNKSYQRQQRTTGSQSAAHFLVSADWPELKGNGYYLSLYFWTACEVVNDILSSREVSAGALLLLLPSFFFLLFYSEGIVCQSCDVTPT